MFRDKMKIVLSNDDPVKNELHRKGVRLMIISGQTTHICVWLLESVAISDDVGSSQRTLRPSDPRIFTSTSNHFSIMQFVLDV